MKKIFFILLIITLPVVLAQGGQIKLLALVENGENRSGAVVDLFLEVLPGKERVFLETIPLTKISTQISMRFAQQIACKELEAPCSSYDFFYTIKGFPGVVGGPSAGAAATVLAVSVLENAMLNDSVAITGTINSGGIIGPVGGIKYKIQAAADKGLQKVLIPSGTANYEEDNESINLIDYGRSLGVEVVEVTTLHEALGHFTKVTLPDIEGDFVLSDDYLETMKQVESGLCERWKKLEADVELGEIEGEIANLSLNRQRSLSEGNYYAAASYCFRANVIINQQKLKQMNMSNQTFLEKIDELNTSIILFEEEIANKDVTTLTDLQVLMSIDERLSEAIDSLNRARQTLNPLSLGYAIERLNSARSWSAFFNVKDKKYVVDKERVEQSCLSKIAEAEERYSYVLEFTKNPLVGIRSELNKAYGYVNDKQFVRCLYTASKLKAEIDSLLSVVGLSELDGVLDEKLMVVKKSLLKAQANGVFPIISYNYYEYANSLKGHDKESALLFAEYALEFAGLDIYFDQDKRVVRPMSDLFHVGPVEGFMIGVGVGILFAIIYLTFSIKYVKNRKPLQTPPKRRLRGKKR